MRDYAKVAGTFWTRGSGKRLRGNTNAQVVALYLMTAPAANMLGVYYLPIVIISHETGLSLREVRDAFEVLSSPDIKIAHYDEDAELVWVPAMAGYQIAKDLKPGDKRRGGPILAEIQKIGRHPFAEEFWERYGEGFGLGPYPYEDGPSESLERVIDAPSMGDQPQSGRAREEQEQEQEKNKSSVSPPGEKSPTAFDQVFKHYVQGWHRAFPQSTRPPVPTDKRRSLVKARLKEGLAVDDLKRACDGLWLSSWHMGENPEGKRYTDFDLVMRDAKHVEQFLRTFEEHRPPRNTNTTQPNPQPKEQLTPTELAKANAEARAMWDATLAKHQPEPFPDVGEKS